MLKDVLASSLLFGFAFLVGAFMFEVVYKRSYPPNKTIVFLSNFYVVLALFFLLGGGLIAIISLFYYAFFH